MAEMAKIAVYVGSVAVVIIALSLLLYCLGRR
jgi:hypothetical protein